MKLKKLFLTAFLFSAALCSKAAYTNGTGQIFEIDNLKYEILDEEAKTVGIAGASDKIEDFFYCYCPQTLTIKDEEYTVVQVNDRAFYGNDKLYFISLPSTITDFGASAFANCANVYFQELPSALETIGDCCFKETSSIESITLPETVAELGVEAFAEMPNLRRVVMQNTAITEIKEKTFYMDKELQEVFLPLGVKKIDDEAFYQTLSLTDLYFPEGLEYIGRFAFSAQPYDYDGYRGGLETLELPSTIKEIGRGAFSPIPAFRVDLSKCTNLKEVTGFSSCYNLTSLTLPEGLEKIGDYAFNYIGANAGVGTTDITIPSTVSTIGEGAFKHTKITKLTIGDKVSVISDNTFNEVTSIEIGSGIKTIGAEAFKSTNLRLIHLHTPVPPTFNHNFNLSAASAQNITVIVPDGSIELYAHHPKWKDFNLVEEAQSQVEVTLNGSLGLGAAIYQASGVLPSRITSLKVSGPMTRADLQVISKNMFSLSKLDIYNTTGLTEIPENCFKDNTLLTEMILPESIELIGDYAFYGCTSLRIDKLPESLRSIGDKAFENCSSLNITELPDALESIGYRAFSDCISLRSITAGPNLSGRIQATFSFCRLLEYVDLSRTKITAFGSNVVYVCESLRTILLPETLTSFNHRDFAITGLRSITLPGALRNIGTETFVESPIKAICIGNGIQTVGESLFEQCAEIVSASLPASTESLGEKVFASCPRLRFLSCAAKNAPSTESNTFEGILTQKSTLTVPADAFFSYLNAPGWGKFGNFEFALDVDVPDNVDVTVVPEEDYEEMVQDEELENEQMENSIIPGEPENIRARRLKARKDESSDLLSGKHFAKVFNGATIQSSDRKSLKGNRFFIFGEAGKDYEKVMFNDNDITDEVVNGQIVLPADAVGTLTIVKAPMSAIAEIESELNGSYAVYNLHGVKVGDSLEGLPHGIYLVKQGSKTTKHAI